ncbi:hypothetical protein ACFWIB_43130 [Streptomyces sp. NPDC127051]|uniref:hypothetical protein n=1 Tax=Streptomyces sp. NPDC127051 TaxID=3347119 RepID=UPI0036539467
MSLSSHSRRLLRAAGSSLLLVAGALIAAPSAQASPISVVCPGYETNAYNPAFTATPQSVTVTTAGTVGPCAVLLPDNTLPTTATFGGTGTGTVSCAGGSFTGTRIYHWGDGETTTESYTAVISERPAGEIVAVYTGNVTAGLYLGYHTAVTITVFNTTPQGCLDGTGVRATGGPFTVTFNH